MGKFKFENGLVWGVGIYTDGKYKRSINGKDTREYISWRNMLMRAYSEKYHKNYPTYIETIVCDRWLNFQNFAEDINNMIGYNEVDFNGKSFALEKDMFGRGNKSYSKETCVFVPEAINNFLTNNSNHKSSKKELPVGVYKTNRATPYISRCRIDGKVINLGIYKDIPSAENAYCNARNKYARELVERYKNQIDPRVYKYLSTYNEVWHYIVSEKE